MRIYILFAALEIQKVAYVTECENGLGFIMSSSFCLSFF